MVAITKLSKPMDELYEFCVRMVSDGGAAARVADQASEAGADDRLAVLGHAVQGCRAEIGDEPVTPSPPAAAEGGLPAAVANELSTANAALPQRHREALALRELMRLSHQEVGEAIGIEPAAVPVLLARSRLGLRAQLRGAAVVAGDCPERDRMLRTATLRQDGEPVPSADDDWFVDHLGHCSDCARLHAAMLEGSVCYRGWPVSPPSRSAQT